MGVELRLQFTNYGIYQKHKSVWPESGEPPALLGGMTGSMFKQELARSVRLATPARTAPIDFAHSVDDRS
ncbi:Hypothetical protein NTJ_08505 [Nesidiocoris tenuis]|uniref:Uncharacterized protein n=1 Tax=Nesidiocoris tenuis TaxID=355587 RepID=A0ABN7AU16_9HEMI|nr:Hypothetical protein NTJ_08505 [Nesidiocoris tenuis]